jgi:hypothetical protein
MRLCNFLGGCGEASHQFSVSEFENVTINSVRNREMKKKSVLLISGQASTSVCGGGRSVSNLEFSWKLEPISLSNASPGNSSSPILQSTSNDPRTFRLPAYSLEVGSLYSLTLTVRHSISSRASSSSISIRLLRGGVIPVISGSSEKLLNVDGVLLLDGSASYDEDVPRPNIGSLLYSFSCVQLEPSYSGDCHLNFIFDSVATTSSASSSSFFSSSTTLISVKDSSKPSYNLTSNTVWSHEVTMRVKSADNRISSVSVRVRVLPSESPLISIVSLSGTRINPSQKLKLSGEVLSGAGVQSGSVSGVASWRVDDASISLVARSLSDISKNLMLFRSGSTVMSLVLSPDTLPQQSRFVFTLSCVLSSGYSSSSSIVITTNSPPLPGAYEVSPVRGGRMMETVFEFVAFGWEDADLDFPLTYEFSYQSTSTSSTSSLFSSSDYLVHRSRLEVSYSSSKLPRGRRVVVEDEGELMLLSTRVRIFTV